MLKNKKLELVISIVIGIMLFFLMRFYVFSSFQIVGSSMSPNLINGDKVLILKLFYAGDKIKRGDIVVFNLNKDQTYVKRVIGLPGDLVTYRQNEWRINNNILTEDYLEDVSNNDSEVQIDNELTFRVDKGEVFVLGDNREQSLDSRYFGNIPIKKIIGKVWFKY